MRAIYRAVAILGARLAALLAALVLGPWISYGGGDRFPDRTSEPLLPDAVLEVVADLDLPPGNIGLSPGCRPPP